MLYYLGYFILNLIYDFKDKNELNEIKNIDKVINTLYLLHKLDWTNCKEIIPFYVESLKIIIEFAPGHYFPPLYQILKVLTIVIINKISNKTETRNDIISLKRILQLISDEQDKKSFDENRNTAILPLETIITSFLNMIKLLITDNKLDLNYLKLCKIFKIVTNLVYDHRDIYKAYFDDKIIYNRKLKKILLSFCKKFKINDTLIYTKNNKNNTDLKDFNEFLGLTLPKLYIILQITDEKNNIKNENDTSCIISLCNNFYKKVFEVISKNKTAPKENIITFLSTKNKEEKDEVIDILNNVESDALNNLELLFGVINKAEKKFSLINPDDIPKETEIDQLDQYDNDRPLKFNEIWNKIQLEINYRKGLNKFQEIVKFEINKDREKYVKDLFIFFNNIDLKEDDKNLKPSISFYIKYFDCFKNCYGKDFINYKSELYFFYWSNIYIMEYNRKEDNFNENISKYNKEYFNNSNIIEFTIEQFGNVNDFSNTYENLLFIKFFNSYLCQLNDDTVRAKYLNLFIEKQEARNIFSLLRYILGDLQKQINIDISKYESENELQTQTEYQKETKYHFSPHLFENDLDQYELVLELLSNFSENNDVIKSKMKDYLRIQYNKSKYHNFIVILSSIIESFISDESLNSAFEKYFNIIIKVIECITKCCNGSSKENQDCIVKETQMLKFTKFILEKLTYRQKKFKDDGINGNSNDSVKQIKNKDNFLSMTSINADKNKLSIECSEIGLDRKRLAYLKYKLLLFLTLLTVGRKKDDKIYELIHQIIDFSTLINVLIETYKEILIEKNCTDNPSLISFDEDMLLRMNNPEYQNLSNWDYMQSDDNFIIFEIGTYTFILINIYLENLTKPIDNDISEQIKNIKKILKKIKCKKVKKSIFDNTINFINCVGKCFKIYNCNKKVKINEDFKMENSFAHAYSFFFDYTQNIEIFFNNEIIRYYVKLSPICKCLTNDIKEEFHSRLDRTSTKSKIECLFENIEFFQYQLSITKKRLDIFQNHPILELLFNQYKFYRDMFLIINGLINLLIFASFYYPDNSDDSKKKEFQYSFFYKEENGYITEKILLCSTLVEMILAFLIFTDYVIIHIPNLTFYNKNIFENIENEENNNDNEKEIIDKKNKKNYNNKCCKIFTSIVINISKDIKLLFHLFLLFICIFAVSKRDYKFLIILLIDVVERSNILMCIVKSIWLPRTQILVTLFLFYLIAYYFSIFVYLFIPSHVPTNDCIKFSDCFFTLCDQTIKNSNGIINYLKADGLYNYSTLWGNPRFYIDNWFAIIDTMLILQILAGIIIDKFISQREINEKTEKDKKNKCFICGLKKAELNNIYNQLERGFNEHIKLDHNLWNYVFAIFNIMKKNHRNLNPIDLIIYESYKKKSYFTWVPYKTCKLKNDEDSKEDKNKDESEDEDEDEDEDHEDDNKP